MSKLRDRFDILIEKARVAATPERQVDVALGALFGLHEWHFINTGDQADPHPMAGEMDGLTCLVVFSHPEKADEFTLQTGRRQPKDPLGVISMLAEDAAEYALMYRQHGCDALLVNPGSHGFTVVYAAMEKFYLEWKQAGGAMTAGFWIPNMTDEEEDFYQEHGV